MLDLPCNEGKCELEAIHLDIGYGRLGSNVKMGINTRTLKDSTISKEAMIAS